MLFVDYSFYSLVQENKHTFKVLKRDLKLKCIYTRENYLIVLRKVEGSRGVGREMRGGKILKEVVGHYLVEASLGVRIGGAG